MELVRDRGIPRVECYMLMLTLGKLYELNVLQGAAFLQTESDLNGTQQVHVNRIDECDCEVGAAPDC